MVIAKQVHILDDSIQLECCHCKSIIMGKEIIEELPCGHSMCDQCLKPEQGEMEMEDIFPVRLWKPTKTKGTLSNLWNTGWSKRIKRQHWI